jgi:hypothetical protein
MAEDILNFDQEVTLWAQYAAEKLVKALDKHKIGKSGALKNSIVKELNNNGGDVYKAIFKFLQYGRFVDIGTGRGFARGARGTSAFAVSRNENGTLKGQVNRQPKPWYSKTMYREIKILSEKILANMDDKVMDTIQARIRRINNHSSNATS